MAGMAVARSAMVPAGGLSNASRGAAVGGAAAAVAVAGLGRLSLRLPSQRVGVSLPSDAKRSLTIVAVQTEGQTEIVSELSESPAPSSSEIQAAAEDLLKQVKETWAKVDDKLAIGSLGVAALIVLWGSTGLISAIDKLPLIPQVLELVGLLYTGWFVYRYLLFKPDREELLKVVDETKSKITGQDDL
ncbi:unnamed protein product [Calypogeia fissa]